MRTAPVLVVLALALVLAGCAAPAEEPPTPSTARSPYAGDEAREIKALSEQEVADLLAGKGMGYALAAELNSYPGPLHALELADALNLSAEQRARLQEIRQGVLDAAIPLGKEIVQAEAELDRMFAEGDVDSTSLAAQLDLVARLQGELRFAHLDAHLATRALMSTHQVTRYNELRGYDAGHEHVGDHAAHG